METKDLIIRKSNSNDLQYFYQWELKPEVTRFFSIDAHQSFDTVLSDYVHANEDPSQRQYTIVLKETSAPIGRIVLKDLVEGWKVEIWRIYIADTSLRNRGLGRQAMLALLQLCFNDFSVERVYLDHYSNNPASFLYLSLGFVYEGILRKNCRKNNTFHDVHLMSLLKEEYCQQLYNK